MSELQDALHKFEKRADNTGSLVDRIDPSDPNPHLVEMALAEAKRVRRESIVLVRALARLRDQLQP